MKTLQPNDVMEMMFDFEALQPETVKLEPEQIDEAVQLFRQMPHQGRQWQTYINALALFGFQQWLKHRAPEIALNQEHCSVLHPALANLIERVGAGLGDAATNIAGFLQDQTLPYMSVGKFKVCLIAVDSLWDEEITIPRAAIDLPEFTPHFYVLVEVEEELGQATIQSFLRYDQLRNRFTGNQEVNPDWTYTLPLAQFERDPDRLLLYLDCLEPAAIPLPTVTPAHPAFISRMQAELTALLPQIQSAREFLWQVLTWEQAAILLQSPELLTWLYQQIAPNPVSPLIQPAINVGLWLHNQMDELTQELAWVLLPPIAQAMRSAQRVLSGSPLRSPVQELGAIVREVETRTGTKTPTIARGAYQDFQLGESQLRLYAVIWPLPPVADIPEWTLLLVLGAQPTHKLPDGIKLQVSDQTQVLVERTFDKNTGDTYLYVRVAGQWDETFLATIALTNGVMLTLPPFAFDPA